MDLRAQAMTKIFKHRLQVFAAYEQPLCLFAIRCAEQMTIAYIPGVVHPVTAFCYFFLYEFEMFQIVRELVELGDQQLGDIRSFLSRQITAVQEANKVIYVSPDDKSVHWTPKIHFPTSLPLCSQTGR